MHQCGHVGRNKDPPVVQTGAASGGAQFSQDQYTAPKYVLSKTLAELPLDALVAATFADLLHRRAGQPQVVAHLCCVCACVCVNVCICACYVSFCFVN